METRKLLLTIIALLCLVQAKADVEINETNFPDANFRKYLKSRPYGKNGVITEAAISDISEIDVRNLDISDLRGIEYFTALNSLFCSNNQLTSLNVSKNTLLRNLWCHSNQIKGKAMDELIASLPIVSNGSCTLRIISYRNEDNDMTTMQVATAKDKGWIPYCCCYNGEKWVNYYGCAEINETNFPDENFRNFLTTKYGEDGVITGDEITNITSMNVSSRHISDLKGIEYFSALTTLSCYNNQLTSFNISKNTLLTYLDCSYNQLTLLYLPANTLLTYLDCSYNQLTDLDVSKKTALTGLSCSNNQLTSLYLQKNTSLIDLSCYNNQLTSLNVSKNTLLRNLWCNSNQIKGKAMDELIASLPIVSNGSCTLRIISYRNEDNVMTTSQVAAAKAKGWIPYCYNYGWEVYAGSIEGIEINETNFPDENFRNYLKAQSYGEDGVITDEEIVGVTSITVDKKQISNLKGIEFFTALTTLSCSNNQLISFNISKNTALTGLSCSNNQLTTLDISKNTALLSLSCGKNQLTTLDISTNTELISLWCNKNKLTSLEVSNNAVLTRLDCRDNQLTSLDVTKNTVLKLLDCGDNQLTSLDVTKNTALTWFSCDDNQFTTLDVSKNTALTTLECDNNQLTTLDVSNNTALITLGCGNNQLTTLDVSNNTALATLACFSNQIKGEAMDALVESLPTIDKDSLYLYIIYNENEGNEMRPIQVAAAKAKGCIPQYYNGSNWAEYAGSPVEFKLTYMVDGVEYKNYDVEYGATITPEADPQKETYRFSGWSEIPETMPSHDVTITGTFERYLTIGNVVRLISFIINENATSDELSLYDQNTDGELNIGDIILFVKWILNNDNSGPSNSRTRSYDTPDWTQYTAAQFDVKTTADTNIKEIRLVKGMEQTHQMMYHQKDAYTYTVVVYSLSNQLMKPENGNIVEITTDKNTLNGVSIENVIVALPTGETESYNGAHLSTNILQIEGEEGPAVVYDLNGNCMNVNSNLKKGVYIVNGKKVIVK